MVIVEGHGKVIDQSFVSEAHKVKTPPKVVVSVAFHPAFALRESGDISFMYVVLLGICIKDFVNYTDMLEIF